MNKWIGTGRLCKDPELTFGAGSGTAICKFKLAVNRRFKKDNQPDCDFINVVCFSKTAENVANYMSKGKQVAIVGEIQTGSYEAKDGTRRYTTDVVASEVEFLGGGNNNSSNESKPEEPDYGNQPKDDDIPF